MKYKSIIFLIITNVIIFYIGVISGKYIQGVKEENSYPFHLRSVFVENQPTCETYLTYVKNNISIDSSIITNDKGDKFVRVISLQNTEEGIKFIVSILDQAHDQFVDEVWLECSEG